MKEQIQRLADKYFERVVTIRRHLHTHPELSWHETETAKLVASTLSEMGIPTQTGIAKNGVIGILKGKNPDARCIALRADMDALPIQEQNKVSYCSVNDGVMHACGHDVHTSNLLGVAMILSELKDEIEGTIKFIFQPSEEKVPSGAEAMIKEGALENPKPERIFGLHVSPELEVGTFGFCSGKFMASSDELYITIKGKGGHAAKVEELNNPLLIAADFLQTFKPVTDLSIPLVLSFGKIEGKGATNIVPDVVEIAGTLRCFDESLRTEMHQKLEATCREIAERNHAQIDLNILKGYPVLINNTELTDKVKSIASGYIDSTKLLDIPTRMGSEDFAYYTHHLPACFYRLGVGNKEKGITSNLHTPTFDVDENALKQSIGLMSWIAMNA